MRIAHSMLRPATFDAVLSCRHGRLREALLQAMPSPKLLDTDNSTEDDEDDGFAEAISAILCSVVVLSSVLFLAPFL